MIGSASTHNNCYIDLYNYISLFLHLIYSEYIQQEGDYEPSTRYSRHEMQFLFKDIWDNLWND